MKTLATIAVVGAMIAIVLLTLTGFTWHAAQQQTVIKVAPQTSSVKVGDQTTVDLAIEKVADLYGVQLHLTFDPQVVEVVDADPSQDGIQVELGTFPVPDFIVQNTADNQAGTIDYVLTQLPPSKPSSGEGIVARVTFRAKKAAVSQVQFEQYLLADTQGSSIDATPQHGQVRVTGGSGWILAVGAGIAALLVVGGGIGFVLTKGK